MDLSSRACLIVHKLNIPVKAKKKCRGSKDQACVGLRKKRNESDDERKEVMMRGKDRGRVTQPLLRLRDKEALVFMPRRE